MRKLMIAAVAALLVGIGVRGAGAESPAAARPILAAAGVEGGLVVHVGCDEGRLAAALCADERFLVHALAADAGDVAKARERLRALGRYGPVSVDRYDGRRLPYVDNLVNLVVVSDAKCRVPAAEIARVLAPNGVVAAVEGYKLGGAALAAKPAAKLDGWTLARKPRPKAIDEWTHFLHGPDNNAVAADRVVGPPRRLQWIAPPVHLRSHEHLNSVSALVSAAGRVFYIIDEGATAAVAAEPDWRLVARDAFNGVLLWKRRLGPWEGHFRLFRSGPPAIARRLVAVGDRVYATLGYGEAVAAFDAATGKTLRTYDATEGALEIVCDAGRLFVVVGEIDLKPPADPARRFAATPPPHRKGLVALDADTGRVLWKRRDKDTAELMPTTLAVSAGRLFFQNTKELICLDSADGGEQWRARRPVYTTRLSWSAPTLVVHDGVVLSADGSTGGLKGKAPRGGDKVEWIMSDRDIRTHPAGDLVAFSAETGKRLWTGESLQGFCNPGDLFVIAGLVWAGANVAPRQMGLTLAVDLHTGEVKKRLTGDPPPAGGHTRCFRDKATQRFLVLGGTGVEFVDVRDWSWQANPWVRGTCQYGVMPCNGLLYVPPDSCACRPEMRLHGFTAMAPPGPTEEKPEAPNPLEKGRAYGKIEAPAVAEAKAPTDEREQIVDRKSSIANHAWPTYRHDAARSGRTPAAVPVELQPAWQAKIGGELTSVTVAEGKVFVARVDTHGVYALDAESGQVAWRRTVGAGVDSPPTIHAGRAIFGCRDGWVYCLRASDGATAWRFRAAPRDRRLVAMDRLESVWPVHGSVLVRAGRVWLAAGRSPYLDGGIRLIVLDAATGKAVFVKRLDSRDDGSFRTSRRRGGAADRTPPMLPDILSAVGDLVYMRWMGFDAKGEISRSVQPHLFSATGFLDDTWWHRTYWQYGTWMRGGFGGWPQAARRRPAGRIMCVGDDALYGFGRSKYDVGNPRDVHAGHVGVVKDGYQDSGRIAPGRNPYHLFSCAKANGAKARRGAAAVGHTWDVAVPMLVRGMVLAGERLFIAGPPLGKANGGLAELDAARPGMLWAASTADGKKLGGCELAAGPVLDGMAAVPGRLILSCTDGTVRCLAGRGKGARQTNAK